MSDSPAYVPLVVRASLGHDRPFTAGGRSLSADDGGDDSSEPLDADDQTDDNADDDAAVSAASNEAARDTARGASEAARVREGLPPSYRMRAERHYVEALVDRTAAAAPRSSEPVTSDAPRTAAGTTAAVAAAAASLAAAFESIQAALCDVPMQGRPLRDRVAIELARAEATRGRWLADAARVLHAEPLPALDEVDLVALLAVVLDAFGPENRLGGGAATLVVPAGTCRVFGDERLLTTALGAMLAGVRAIIEDRGDARKMGVALGPRVDVAARTIEMRQSAVRLPASAYGRFFDSEWTEHPAGARGAILLAAAHKIALAHGGSLVVTALDGGGCRLLLSLPAVD